MIFTMPISQYIVRSLPFVAPLKPGEEAQRGTALYILSVVMLLVAGLFVAARVSARLSSLAPSQGLGQDDYCVIASLVSLLPKTESDTALTEFQIASVGLSLTEIQATVYGYGDHMGDLSKTQIHQSLEV
jgi:hypothetical protein